MQSNPSDIEFFRREYARQKKLEEFVTKRPLHRPKTKKWQVILLVSAIPLLLCGSIILTVLCSIPFIYKILVFLLLFILLCELYVRFCLIQVVKCYQHYAKEETRRRCLCIPSCSEYAILSLKRFLLIAALLKIRKRLFFTCKGEMYILDFPVKKMNERFENEYLAVRK